MQMEKQGGAFVLTSNELKDCFHFNPSESYLISYGINFQTDPEFKKKTLGPSSVADAKEVRDSMVNTGVILEKNAVLYEALKQPDDCTANGMKKGFLEQARKVGPNGIFVFHFSGHGIQKGNGQWGLAPVDFDRSPETYLTASVLNGWLREADCKAKHILFTLDCCYAGGIGKELTTSDQLDLVSGLHVLSACTANESCLDISTLGHSFFTYFLCRAIRGMTVHQPGQLRLKEIFTECHTLTMAMSSLIVHYSPTQGLKWGTMEPELRFVDLRAVVREYMGEGPNQTDAAHARFEYATSLYDRSQPNVRLDDMCVTWLQIAATKAMRKLKEQHLMKDQQVLLTVLCSILQSIASIELTFNKAELQNPNHFITSFMHAVAAIDQVHHGVEIIEDQFLRGWRFYEGVVKSYLGENAARERLYSRALANSRKRRSVTVPENTSHSPKPPNNQDDGEDFTDFGQVSVYHRAYTLTHPPLVDIITASASH